ncbi:hypothetical protein B8W66_02840 [Mycobacterium decipiens]|uniref:Uncharacterized protein n=1 Tax=Mycobacterium decipiens TaxID=1430326 RepID=A0A1X2LYW9_9MYCO|nr:hypothetical protein B8W66_02840 [Mycobacterium decipiens]
MSVSAAATKTPEISQNGPFLKSMFYVVMWSFLKQVSAAVSLQDGWVDAAVAYVMAFRAIRGVWHWR